MTYAINFSDEEIPKGGPQQYYLTNMPIPGSLQLFLNGLLLSALADDYILSGQVIVPRIPIAPEDRLLAFYRYL